MFSLLIVYSSRFTVFLLLADSFQRLACFNQYSSDLILSPYSIKISTIFRHSGPDPESHPQLYEMLNQARLPDGQVQHDIYILNSAFF